MATGDSDDRPGTRPADPGEAPGSPYTRARARRRPFRVPGCRPDQGILSPVGYPMSSAQCPNCGLAITDAAATCPLCRASLIRVNTRRVLLWSAVIAEYVLMLLVLHLRR